MSSGLQMSDNELIEREVIAHVLKDIAVYELVELVHYWKFSQALEDDVEFEDSIETEMNKLDIDGDWFSYHFLLNNQHLKFRHLVLMVRNHTLAICYHIKNKHMKDEVKFRALLIGQSDRFDTPIEELFMDILEDSRPLLRPSFYRGEELFQALFSDPNSLKHQARLQRFDAVIFFAGGERDQKLVELRQLMHYTQMLCILAVRDRGVSPIQFLKESMVSILGTNGVWGRNLGLYWVLKSVERDNEGDMLGTITEIVTDIKLRKLNKPRPWLSISTEEGRSG